MAEVRSTGIVGMDEFLKKLERLELSVQKQILTEAVKEGAELIRVVAALSAPQRTGLLRKQIKITMAVNQAKEVIARIGWAKKAFYGMFVELGTKSQAAQPFLEPSFEATKESALRKAMERLKRSIEQSVK
jgi:HK97 gp10 family phage protein